MQVFVWVSYGEIDVYNADTVANVKYLLKHVTDILGILGYGESVAVHLNDLENELETINFTDYDKRMIQYRITINSLLCSVLGNHVAFQRGTGFKRLTEV